MNRKVPEILALYLPQFHRVPENDRWWGKGFTEWTAVRNASPLFVDHNQPRRPLDNYYYNLLDYRTMKWQADLAQKYHVGGFCFYHYWFKDGKRILQKPAENLLGWKDINMSFCFCWANETWCRTWSNVKGGNVWSGIYEEKGTDEQDSNGILLQQKYGREEQWERHFLYLCQFFEDYRYIKVEGRPVFMIYRPDDIPCLYNMIRYWRKMAVEKGFPGIYVIGMDECEKGVADALCVKEPYHAFCELIKEKEYVAGKLKIFEYSEVWEKILSGNHVAGEHFYCAVTDHDTTPRKGINGESLVNVSPELFKDYFRVLVRKSMDRNHRFLFINAWNEWGEGMYLEPDEKTGYAYLESVKQIVEEAEEEAYGKSNKELEMSVPTIEDGVQNEYAIKGKEHKKIHAYYHLLEQWLSVLEKGYGPEQFFIERNMKKVAVYGVGILGSHLARELTQGGIEVVCGIDMGGNRWQLNIPVVDSLEDIPVVDAVVVTPFLDFGDILERLETKLQCNIFSIRELVYELL